MQNAIQRDKAKGNMKGFIRNIKIEFGLTCQFGVPEGYTRQKT